MSRNDKGCQGKKREKDYIMRRDVNAEEGMSRKEKGGQRIRIDIKGMTLDVKE